MKTLTLILVLLLWVYTASAWADSPVWKVTKDGKTLYVGGTIHLLSEQDYPLPDAFNIAFEQADELVFETDIENMSSLATQAKFMAVLMYQNGETIESALSMGTYTALKKYLSARNLPLSMFERFTPAGLNMTLLVLELQRLGISGDRGVETYFNQRAKAQGKDIEWLESLDEQMAFIGKMNQLDADRLLGSTLRDISQLEQQWPKLLAAWRAGDTHALTDLGIDTMLEESPELYEFILADRNREWLPELKAMLLTPDVEFVLVGALHLAGKDSVLSLLQAEGFKIEQLD